MKKYSLEILAFIVLLGGMAAWGASSRKAVDPSYVAPRQAPPISESPNAVTGKRGYIEEVPIEDQDAVKLMGLTAHKWKLGLPRDAKKLIFWIEDWRNAEGQPVISHVSFTILNPQDASAPSQPQTLLLKLPDKLDNNLRRSLQGESWAPAPELVTENWKHHPDRGNSVTTMWCWSHAIPIGEEVILAGRALVGPSSSAILFDKKELARSERTYLMKMYISDKDVDVWPRWENGKVVLKKW